MQECTIFQGLLSYRPAKAECSFLVFFNWSRVHLLCCVTFCCTAQCISYTYTYIHTLLDSYYLLQTYFPLSILKIRPLGGLPNVETEKIGVGE